MIQRVYQAVFLHAAVVGKLTRACHLEEIQDEIHESLVPAAFSRSPESEEVVCA